MYTIPINSKYPTYSFEIELDSEIFILKFSWNTRGGFWSMSISGLNDNILIAGIKLVLDYELIRMYPDRGLPKGGFIMVSMDDNTKEITRENLGTDIIMSYIEEAEIV